MVDIPALTASVTVPSPPHETFSRFTDGFGAWWPAEFTWSQPALLESIAMDCRPGGLLTETGPHGFRIDWGRIQRWNPPTSLSFTWQISDDRVPVPDPAQASTVTASFTAEDGGTTVVVAHDDWDRHGENAATYRDQFAGAWPMALDRSSSSPGDPRRYRPSAPISSAASTRPLTIPNRSRRLDTTGPAVTGSCSSPVADAHPIRSTA